MCKVIVIVEDEALNAEYFEKIVGEALIVPYVPIVLDSMAKVRDFLQYDNRYDCILLDGAIKGGHTRDVLDQLDASKVIVVSADSEYCKQAKTLGCDIEQKSVHLTNLMTLLQKKLQT